MVSDLLVAAALGPFFLVSQGCLPPPMSPGQWSVGQWAVVSGWRCQWLVGQWLVVSVGLGWPAGSVVGVIREITPELSAEIEAVHDIYFNSRRAQK